MSGPAFYLSAPRGFLGAELVDRSEQGDHICSNVVAVVQDSGEKAVHVCVWMCVGRRQARFIQAIIRDKKKKGT